MVEVGEQVILANIRTLLALKRNFLAEERTALAEFRTGIAFSVIGPTTSTVISYIFSLVQMKNAILINLLIFIFFSILTVAGILTIFHAQSKLKRIRKKKIIIKDREATLIKSSKTIQDLLLDLLEFDA